MATTRLSPRTRGEPDYAPWRKYGVFHSVPDLIAASETYLKATNDSPQPFVWTQTAEQILAKVRRGRVALDAITT